MAQSVLTVAAQVLILFILIGVGFLCGKARFLTDSAVKGFTDIVLYIVTPCVIIHSYQREFDPAMLKALLISATASLASFALDILLAELTVHDKDKKREKVLKFGVVFSNCGYMSLPLQSALLGEEGVFYGATYVALFNIVMWTYGVIVMSGDKKSISIKKIVLNPGMIGTAAGILLFLSSIRLPTIIGEPISYLAALNTPVPMMIIGYNLSKSKISIRGANAYFTIVMRLVVTPLLMLGGLYICGIKGSLMISLVVALSAPIAAGTTMFSEKYGADTPLSAALVSVSTLLCIVTMPLIVGLAGMAAK